MKKTEADTKEDKHDEYPENDPWVDGTPYLRLYTTPEEAKVAWTLLKSYTFNLREPSTPYVLHNVNLPCKWVPTGEYFVIPIEKELYYTVNFLTDFFTEPGRLRAHRYNQPSAYEVWKHRGAQYVIANPEKTKRQYRDWLYTQTFEICNCRLTVAATILDMFQPTSIFEPCAGRGSIAFAAYSRSYVKTYQGCEPNLLCATLIENGLKELRDFESELCPETKDMNRWRMFTVHPTPVELFLEETNARMYDENGEQTGLVPPMYNMVWACPPYFDVEIYGTEPTQSIERFPEPELWYENWLLPMLRESWNRLKNDGVLLVSMNNARDHSSKKLAKQNNPLPFRFQYTERMVKDLSANLLNNTYLGVISYKDGHRYEPTFVWRKTSV